MKLMDWIRMHEAGVRARRALGAILLGQAALAAAALGTDLLRLCGSCGAGFGIHAGIAGIGLLGYLSLLVLLRLKAWMPVYAGVFAAAGVHLALGALMIAQGSFCPICALSAILSLAGPSVLLRLDREAVRWTLWSTAPACILSGLVTWTAFGTLDARAEAARAQAREAARLLLEGGPEARQAPSPQVPELHVFQHEHCPYCREFREDVAPRLRREFPHLEIVYHPADGVPWVRRTPTFVLGGEVLFEGLPVDSRDLARSISRALEKARVARR